MVLEELQNADDAELVIATLAGNHEAFGELVFRYRRGMLAVAQQIVRNPMDAEDIVQDALIRAFEALPQLEDLNRFGAWLYSITRNHALRTVQREARYQLHEDVEAEFNLAAEQATSDPAQISLRESTHQAVRDAIGTLPAEFQEVISLYYWAEMPQKRIAEVLSLPLTTVKWRLHKAKELLETLLKRQGYGEEY